MKKLVVLLLALFLFSACSQSIEKETGELTIDSLSGPTTIQILSLMHDDESSYNNRYNINIQASADLLLPSILNGDCQIACLPANVAATVYNKLLKSGSSFTYKVVSINVLGVLDIVENGNIIHSLEDLCGKTVYLTGQGTTGEYALTYLLQQNGILDQVQLQFCANANEVATLLADNVAQVACLPQPFVTVASMKNKNLNICFELKDMWQQLGNDTQLITGVTIVRSDLLDEQPELIASFLEDQHASVKYVNTHVETAAKWCVEAQILQNESAAQTAIPLCNLTFISSDEMIKPLSNYFNALYSMNPAAVGGALPDEDFYVTHL